MFLIGWYRFCQIVRSLLGLMVNCLVLGQSTAAQFKALESGRLTILLWRVILRALSLSINKLFKYVDDTTLLVPQFTYVTLEDEFGHGQKPTKI
jgi:hypothetical protein